MKRWAPAVCLFLCLACDRGWSVAVLGDSDIGRAAGGDPPVLSRMVEAINREAPERVFFLGDLVHGRTLLNADKTGQYAEAQKLLKGSKAPVSIVPGNHDVEGPGGLEEFVSRFGAVPWVVEHRGWRFIGLNTEEPGARGAVTGSQREWLERELFRPGGQGRTVVFMHRPVWPAETLEYGLHSLPQPDLHDLFRRAGVAAVLSGHEHHFRREGRDGILYVTTGGAGATLLEGGDYHFVRLSVRGDQIVAEKMILEPGR